jgi:hypothetical protein
MAKRKKRILFDVLGTGGSVLSTSRKRRKGGSQTSDLRVTQAFCALAVGLFVVFVGLSYYLGTVNGAKNARQGRVAEDDPAGLQRSWPSEDRVESGFSVRARATDYGRYTRDDAIVHLRELQGFLLDQGFEEVALLDYPDDGEGATGELVVWVGRASSKEDLKSLARELRALTFRGAAVFSTAYPSWRAVD